MYYKMKKIPKSTYILIGKRMTNKDALTKAFDKGYNEGYEAGFEAGKKAVAQYYLDMVYHRITDLSDKVDATMQRIKDVAKEDGIVLE